MTEPISFGLAIIAEARVLVTSISNRIGNYQAGPSTFRALNANIDRLARHILEVETLLQKFPEALPADISVVFNETFASVRQSLDESSATMEQSFSKVFAQSSSSWMEKLRSKALRVMRASALKNRMDSVESLIRDASTQLLQLTLALGNALKIHQQQAILIENLGNPVGERQVPVEIGEEVYRPAASTPAPTHTVSLDFEAKDEHGNPTTPEGILKHSVMSSISSEVVTVAAGAVTPAYGVLGMAGVGKTVALQGLGHDVDIQTRFYDGIHFMTFGRGATRANSYSRNRENHDTDRSAKKSAKRERLHFS